MANGMDGVLGCIGNTPLVEFTGFLRDIPARVFGKLEFLNPGGSVKDRTALSMIGSKIASGDLIPGVSTVVESSSGNLAIGLAQICRYYGLQFRCVVDANTTPHNVAILHALGATVEVITEPDPTTGDLLGARLARVRALLAESPDRYWPNQYANPLNPDAHEATMREIIEQLGAAPDIVLCATGTCGTIVGLSRHIRQHGLGTRVIGVDAVGSAIFGDAGRPRLVPGHGAGRRPEVLDLFEAPAEIVHVSDWDCVEGCHRLVAREAVLAGGSAGAVVTALEKVRGSIPAGATVVLILPDRGERYMHTIYDPDWVSEKFGPTRHLGRESGIVALGRAIPDPIGL